MQFAYIEGDLKLFYAYGVFQPFAPNSAVVSLIQGIYKNFPGEARRILRKKIRANYKLTPMCKAMIRVAAKRFSEDGIYNSPNELIRSDIKYFNLSDTLRETPLVPSTARTALSDKEWMGLACEKASQIVVHEERFNSPRKVAAILVNTRLGIFEEAQNSNSKDKTAHAEINLVQTFFSKYKMPIPEGSRIYSSLKPCKMCAAMICQSFGDSNDITLFYAENDPGPFAQRTVLQEIQRQLTL